MTDIHDQIQAKLDKYGKEPILGDLIPEDITAEVLGLSRNHFSLLAREGRNLLPYVKRNNRRFYSINEIARFATMPQDN